MSRMARKLRAQYSGAIYQGMNRKGVGKGVEKGSVLN